MSFMLGASLSHARIPDFESRFYFPLKEKKDLSFEINSSLIGEILQLENKKGEYSVKAYKYKDLTDISLSYSNEEMLGIHKTLQALYLLKAQIVWGIDLSSWLVTHKFVQEQDGWFVYHDPTGILKSREIKIKFIQNKLMILENRNYGLAKTTYYFSSEKWAKQKLVLKEVERETTEGDERTKTESKIIYKKINKVGFLPVEVRTEVTQTLDTKKSKTIKRNFTEVHKFGKYAINTGKAKKWFVEHN